MEKELESVLAKFDLFGIIYADIDGKNIVKLGNLESLPEKGLIQTLFGGEIEIQNLHNTVFGRQLPFGWGQGRVRSYIDITTNGKIFGVFNVLKEGVKFDDLNRKKQFIQELKTILQNS